MGWFNDLLVKVGIKEAPKPKRKYVRKAPAVKKPKAEKPKAAADQQAKVGAVSGLADLANKPLHPMDSYLNGGGESHGIR